MNQPCGHKTAEHIRIISRISIIIKITDFLGNFEANRRENKQIKTMESKRKQGKQGRKQKKGGEMLLYL